MQSWAINAKCKLFLLFKTSVFDVRRSDMFLGKLVQTTTLRYSQGGQPLLAEFRPDKIYWIKKNPWLFKVHTANNAKIVQHICFAARHCESYNFARSYAAHTLKHIYP